MVLLVALIVVIASTAAAPRNSNSHHDLPSLFMLNYDKHTNDEHLNWFNAINQSNQNKPSTTQATTSTTTTTTIPTTAISSTTTIETTTADTTTLETTTQETTTLETTSTTLPPTTTRRVIFSGETAVEGEFPFMVLVTKYKGWNPEKSSLYHRTWERSCSGTLVSENYVLSVTACDTEYRQYRVFVAYGGSEVNVAKEVYPPIGAKIVLMKLGHSVQLSSTAYTACLRKVGGGHTSGDQPVLAIGHETDSTIVKSTYDIYPNSRCNGSEKFGDLLGCAGMAGGQRTRCSWGYTGGPLLVENANYSTTTSPSKCRYWVVGIVSHGQMHCGGLDKPDTFTRIDLFVEWIEGVIHK